MYFIYVYLDTRKKGSYSYGEFHFEYEPFYIGKGTGDRHLSHLRVAKGFRKGKNNKLIAKIKNILNDGFEPEILKILDNLTKETYNYQEIQTIKTIGKITDGGPLINIMDGGDGGVTWVGNHHNKGKKLEEIVGENKATELRQNLSEQASKRVGELNPNWGNRGLSNPVFGFERSKDIIDKIRKKTLEQFSNYSVDEINFMVKRMNDARSEKPDELKQVWYENHSFLMRKKFQEDELFTDEHREKLSQVNYKKINKGSDELKLSEETKLKISNKLKNRKLTEQHKLKLRKTVSFESFEEIINHLIEQNLIRNISDYRRFARINKEKKLPIRPELSYKEFWSSWRKYGF